MSDPFCVILVLAAIIGVVSGFTDKRPSFWRGIGEALLAKVNAVGTHTSFSTTTTPGSASAHESR
jgi:hypothetical protein